MRTRSLGHALVTLAVTAAVVGPMTASAAPTQAEVALHLAGTTVAVGGPAKTLTLGVDTRGRFVTLAQAVVTFEFRRAAAALRLAAVDGGWKSCTPGPGRLVCVLPADWDLYGDRDVLPAVAVTAPAGAPVGGTAAVAATLTDRGIGSVTTAAKVRLTEHLALAVGVDEEVAAAPDSGFSRTLVVRNNGRKPIAGLVAEFDGSYNVDSAETSFRNCRYDEDGYLLSCSFDRVLAPGRSYRAVVPMWVDGAAHAPGRQLSRVTWLTAAEAADEQSPAVGAAPGTGPELVLAEVTGPAPRTRAGDAGAPAHVSRTHVTVTGRHGADVAVVGSAVPGRVGRTVDLTVTLANHGPADLETLTDDAAVAAVDVTLPAGVTLVEEPEAFCETRDTGAYRCYSAEPVLAAGDIEEIVFTVRVDALVGDGGGRAVLVTDDPDLVLHQDLDSINDVGSLVVTG
ncbi:hypothetical protein GCM10010124_05460 [Pilimelia terevasa]|uniref:DUF11 domain-containing protein n=1 Tax=Pilimelia terevasa TaxID=53372 RepID=A0A8J3BFH4_9ACTN|nr:hypothetical protein [Pilimelia terevasa]GGK15636.1 hypothetical protein GCM10010124_05460 [Pilimelia terevasa]